MSLLKILFCKYLLHSCGFTLVTVSSRFFGSFFSKRHETPFIRQSPKKDVNTWETVDESLSAKLLQNWKPLPPVGFTFLDPSLEAPQCSL